ncbi:hypothetical protein KIPB_015416, partial [Kipferlia bialata]|eukprot:g15416.t1
MRTPGAVVLCLIALLGSVVCIYDDLSGQD